MVMSLDQARPVTAPVPAGAARTTGTRFDERGSQVDAFGILVVYAFCLFLVPSRLVFGPLGAAGTPATLFALIALTWYLLSWVVGKRQPAPRSKPVRVVTLFFLSTVMISYAAGMLRDIDSLEVLAAQRGLIMAVAWVSIAVIAAECFDSYLRLDRLLRLLVVFGSVVGALGILQFLTGVDIVRYIVIPGLSQNVHTSSVLIRDEFNRPSSMAAHPIEFGVVMAMLLPLAVQQAFDSSRGTKWRRWAPVVLIGTATPMSVSRSAILGVVIVGVLLFPTWEPRRQRRALVTVLLSTVLLRLAIPGLVGTIRNLFTHISQDTSTTARTRDYAAVSHFVRESPLVGRGFGTFLPEHYRILDNQYMVSLVETGVLGVAALLALMLVGICSAAIGRTRCTDPQRKATGQALVTSVAVAAVSFVTFDAMSFPMVAGLLFLLLGCCGAYLRLGPTGPGVRVPSDGSSGTTETG